MDKNIEWHHLKRLDLTKKALEKNNYEVHIVSNKEEAVQKVNELIADNSIVSFGGSMTLIDAGILDSLRNRNLRLLDRYKQGLNPDDIAKMYRDSFFSDYYLTSSNAITENGELANLDGNGNRVAAMIFGPKKVIIIAGRNKIVKNLEEAYNRIRNFTSPINCKRLNKDTPCTKLGECVDCSSEQRICNHYVVTYRQNSKDRGIVILINEEIGY